MLKPGLTTTISSAVSGLKANQSAMSVLANNIANVNTENFAKRKAILKSQVIAGIGVGVNLHSIQRSVDEFLSESIRDQQSILNKAGTIDEYYEKIQILLGKPNTNTDLDSAIRDFFSGLKSLSETPSDDAVRLNTIGKASVLADRISGAARSLQDLRYEVDRDILNSVNMINQQTSHIKSANQVIGRYQDVDLAPPDIFEDRDIALQKLSEQIDINTYFSNTGQAFVSTASGQEIVGVTDYVVDYIPSSSINNLINNSPFQPVTVSILESNDQKTNTQSIVSGGKSAEVVTKIRGGRLKGLLEMRDQILPDMLSQLDNLAKVLVDQINSSHNRGNGFPASLELTGTTLIKEDDSRMFSGKFMMAVLDSNGLPVNREDGSIGGTPLKPLIVDLNKLNSGYSSGEIDVKTIINEINQYFYHDLVSNRLRVGNLYDIKIAATDDLSFAPNGQFSFDFELNNDSQNDAKFEVVNVNVSGGAAGVSGALPGVFTAKAGERVRTGLPISIDFAGGGGGPYDVDVQIAVTNGATGDTDLVTARFIIDDDPASLEVRNRRYTVDSLISGDPDFLIASPTTQGMAWASIVDKNGVEVNDGSPGYLQIKGLPSGYHIAFDQLDSKELGLPYVESPYFPGIEATNKNFSHFFGLNNLFVDNYQSENAALNMKVREDMLTSPRALSTGFLNQSPAIERIKKVGVQQSTATLTISANPALSDSITINGQIFTFVNAAVNDNEITLGASLDATLDNIVGKLNAANLYNTGSVDKASYTTDSVRNIYINHNIAGSIGNLFTLSFNFTTATASINNAIASTANNGNLIGGIDDNIKIMAERYTYQLGISNNQAADLLYSISNYNLAFKPVGSLPAFSNTISGYAATIVSYAATNAVFAKSDVKKEKLFYDGYIEKFQGMSGVNLNEEVANTIIYQNAYSANARLVSVVSKMYDFLFDAIR